jgi:D-glycero-alpha-D-manno-heptose-7-phosphate kinase
MSESTRAERICARAPVRVDPAGAGTDCPPFSHEHGGLVVNIAIDRYVYASFERLPREQGVIVFSRDYGVGVHAASVADLDLTGPYKFLAAFAKRLVDPGDGCLLITDSRLPDSSGLGGSGAVGVAVTSAIHRAYSRERTPQEIAEEANAVERVDLGFPGGSQDSYGAALGGINLVQYVPGGGTTYRKIQPSPDAVMRLERDSLLIYTGSGHVSGSIHDDIRQSYARPDSPTLRAMFGLREEAAGMAACLEAGDIAGYARAMKNSRFHHYGLHPSCDSDRLREFFRALDPLILGGKTCGAGGGGFILICVAPDRHHACLDAITALGGRAADVWPLAIDWHGVRTWSEAPTAQSAIDSVRARIAAA